MRAILLLIIALSFFCACSTNSKQPDSTQPPLIGTWKLVSATIISGKDTTITDYTKGQEMIKIITPTHFSFLRHDLNQGKDSATAVFVAGGGTVKFAEGKYTEYLAYCSARQWEGGSFELNYEIKNDTLITTAIEKVEKAGVDQFNIEKLIRLK